MGRRCLSTGSERSRLALRACEEICCARDPQVFQYTLRLLVSSLRLTPSGLALRFAPGETLLC
ncbi:MAG: hypothetical protein ACREYE_20835, partial [Gammaproteobacteria bacterium]